jgi:hypothetical protein
MRHKESFVSSEGLFRVSRWIAVLSFLAMFGFSYMPVPGVILVATASLLVASLFYMVFFKCKSCGGRFSSGKGFISLNWPFSRKCRKCGHPLGGANASAA